jgi:hypothetical protein
MTASHSRHSWGSGLASPVSDVTLWHTWRTCLPPPTDDQPVLQPTTFKALSFVYAAPSLGTPHPPVPRIWGALRSIVEMLDRYCWQPVSNVPGLESAQQGYLLEGRISAHRDRGVNRGSSNACRRFQSIACHVRRENKRGVSPCGPECGNVRRAGGAIHRVSPDRIEGGLMWFFVLH